MQLLCLLSCVLHVLGIKLKLLFSCSKDKDFLWEHSQSRTEMIFPDRPENLPFLYSPRKCWEYLGDSVFKPIVVCVIPTLGNALMFAVSGRMLAVFSVCLKIMCLLRLLSAEFYLCLLDHAFKLSHTHSRQ